MKRIGRGVGYRGREGEKGIARAGLIRQRAQALCLAFLFAACAWMATGSLFVARASVVHVVKQGETLTHIARVHGTTVEALIALNDLENPNRLRVGQRLLVSGNPLIHVVARGETLWEIARRYDVTVEQLASWNGISDPRRLREGQELFVSAGSVEHRVRPGETISAIANRYSVTVQSLVAINNLANPNRIMAGQTLLIPPTGGGAVEVLARSSGQVAARRFQHWPLKGTISSGFGPRNGRPHEGIDIPAPHGSEVRAVASGLVSYADWAGTYGLLIKIDHGNGIETRYAHNSRLTVKPGERVSAGQVIARVGSTGRSTAPHLHFEVRVNGEAVDPRPWLP